MKVYVVVEWFKGGKKPEIKGVYKDRIKAKEITDNYRFAFIDEQVLLQMQADKEKDEVYVLYELLVLNVPRIIGVFKDENLAKDMAKDGEYENFIIKQVLA